MPKRFTTRTVYFLQEGKENLDETLAIAFRSAKLHNITTIVIFTAKGEGVRIAIERFLSQPEYIGTKVVGVTFPQGMTFTDENKKPLQVEISPEDESLFRNHGVNIIKAHLPFDPIASQFRGKGVLAQDLSLVADALNMLCGSMSLCVQAITMACDAAAIQLGEHVIALTSDTAILAQATTTDRMLKELTIREILCKPAIFSIGRHESSADIIDGPIAEERKQIAPQAKAKQRQKSVGS